MNRNSLAGGLFVVGGGQRCGTGLLAQLLGGHPDIEMRLGETQEFLTAVRRKSAAELLLPGRLRGEKHANYYSDPEVVKMMANALPDLKWVVSLRNPVQRIASYYRMLNGPQADPDELLLDPKLLKVALHHTRYARHICNLYNNFGPERVHVLRYEDLSRKNYRSTLAEIFSFLEVRTQFADMIEYRRVKASSLSSKFVYFQRVLTSSRLPFQRPVGWLFKNEVHPVSEGFSDEIWKHLKEEMADLSAITRLDLSHWR